MENPEDIEIILLAMLVRITSKITDRIYFVSPETERERFIFDSWDGIPKTIRMGGHHWTVMKKKGYFSIIDQDTWEEIERYSSSLEEPPRSQLV